MLSVCRRRYTVLGLTSYHEAENCHDVHVLVSTSPSFTPQAHNFHRHAVSAHHSARTEQAAATVLKHARSHSPGLRLAAVHFPSYTLTLHQSILLQSCVRPVRFMAAVTAQTGVSSSSSTSLLCHQSHDIPLRLELVLSQMFSRLYETTSARHWWHVSVCFAETRSQRLHLNLPQTGTNTRVGNKVAHVSLT